MTGEGKGEGEKERGEIRDIEREIEERKVKEKE